MFENIAAKIRSAARLILLVGLVLSLILMIGIWITGGGLARRGGGFTIFVYGLLAGGLGAMASWLGSLFTYGFGQLLEDAEVIRRNTEDTQYSTDVLRRCFEDRRRGSSARQPEQEGE